MYRFSNVGTPTSRPSRSRGQAVNVQHQNRNLRHRIAQLKEDIAEQGTEMMKAANLRRVLRASNIHEKTDDGVLSMEIVCPYVNCEWADEDLIFQVNIPAEPLEELTVNLEAFQRHVDARH